MAVVVRGWLADSRRFEDDAPNKKISGDPTRWKMLFAAAAIIFAVAGGHAEAQIYPNRTITLVIPFAPGGSTSIVGRVIADKMSQLLGQSIVIDNRAGAGGTVGTKYVATSEPDGYTILLGYTGTLAIGPLLYKEAGYDPRKDFAPIGVIGNAPSAVVVHPSFPAKTIAELKSDRSDFDGRGKGADLAGALATTGPCALY